MALETLMPRTSMKFYGIQHPPAFDFHCFLSLFPERHRGSLLRGRPVPRSQRSSLNGFQRDLQRLLRMLNLHIRLHHGLLHRTLPLCAINTPLCLELNHVKGELCDDALRGEETSSQPLHPVRVPDLALRFDQQGRGLDHL